MLARVFIFSSHQSFAERVSRRVCINNRMDLYSEAVALLGTIWHDGCLNNVLKNVLNSSLFFVKRLCQPPSLKLPVLCRTHRHRVIDGLRSAAFSRSAGLSSRDTRSPAVSPRDSPQSITCLDADSVCQDALHGQTIKLKHKADLMKLGRKTFSNTVLAIEIEGDEVHSCQEKPHGSILALLWCLFMHWWQKISTLIIFSEFSLMWLQVLMVALSTWRKANLRAYMFVLDNDRLNIIIS